MNFGPRASAACLLTAVAVFYLPACETAGPAIPIDKPKPLRSVFALWQTEIVADRYLLLPVEPWEDTKDSFPGFASGSFFISPMAWSGSLLGKGYAQRRLNLRVVDLRDGHDESVFDHQVALGGWERSFRPVESAEPGRRLWFVDKLILTARSEDTNGDRQIDARDCASVFIYDLATREIQRISPEYWSVADLKIVNDTILMMMQEAASGQNAAVYVYEPKRGQGRFLAQGLTP